MAIPVLAIIGRLFARGAAGKVARMSLSKELRNMGKDTDVAGGIDIQSHTSAKVKNKGRHYIFDKTSPKDAYGRPFKEYSAGYKKSKNTGKMFRQDSSFANSKAPILTGDLWEDLDHSVDAKRNTIFLGWNAHANKIDWLKKNGRILTDDRYPLPKAVVDKAMKIMNNELKKTMPKGTHHIKVTAKVHASARPKAKK